MHGAGRHRRDDVVRAMRTQCSSAARVAGDLFDAGYRGVDDERSIIYQVRRDAPDGALKEGFLARGQANWLPPGQAASGGEKLHKQTGTWSRSACRRCALDRRQPRAVSESLGASGRMSARLLEVKTRFPRAAQVGFGRSDSSKASNGGSSD